MERLCLIEENMSAHTMRLAELAGVLAQNGIRSMSAKIYGHTALLTFSSFIDAWHAMFILRGEEVDFEIWENDPPRLTVSLK